MPQRERRGYRLRFLSFSWAVMTDAAQPVTSAACATL